MQSPVLCSAATAVLLQSAYLCDYLDWMSRAILLLSISLSCGPCINPYSISCIMTLNILAPSASFAILFFFQFLFKIIYKYTEERRLRPLYRMAIDLRCSFLEGKPLFFLFYPQYFRCIQRHTNIFSITLAECHFTVCNNSKPFPFVTLQLPDMEAAMHSDYLLQLSNWIVSSWFLILST